VSLIPVYFGEATRAIGKPDIGDSFALSPPNAAIELAKPNTLAHRAAERDGLDIANLTDDREPHGDRTLKRDCLGLTGFLRPLDLGPRLPCD
jgi:hypothetical protein